MKRKIPDAITHGITSRIANRVYVEQLEAIEEALGQEHDMTRPLTFIVKGFNSVDFHVMIALRELQWKVSILVVTKTILLTCPDTDNIVAAATIDNIIESAANAPSPAADGEKPVEEAPKIEGPLTVDGEVVPS
ncbi:MAG: hypothetical protein NVV63_12665 [Opitutus sp.]|nr:hypothetical protein [Opitutus sp.]